MNYLFLKDIFLPKLNLFHQAWLDMINEATDADLITEYNYHEVIRPYDHSNLLVVKGLLSMWLQELGVLVIENKLVQTSRSDNLNIGLAYKEVVESDTSQFGVRVTLYEEDIVEITIIGLNGRFEPISVYFDLIASKQISEVKTLLTEELLYLELDKLIANEFRTIRKLQERIYYGPKKNLIGLMDKLQIVLHDNYYCGQHRNSGDDVEQDGFNINPDPTNLIFSLDLITSFVLHWCIQGSDAVSGKFFLPQ